MSRMLLCRDETHAGDATTKQALKRLADSEDAEAQALAVDNARLQQEALAAAAGHPVGDVRPPITTFESLGAEGRERVARMMPLMEELNAVVDNIEVRQAAAK